MTARRDQRGQAAVELALGLPLVALLLLAVVQVGLVVRDQVLATHAAREGARAAAVGSPPEAARAAALSGSGLRGDRVTVDVRRDGELVRVAVRYRAATDLPLVGPLLPDVTLGAKAAMRAET